MSIAKACFSCSGVRPTRVDPDGLKIRLDYRSCAPNTKMSS